MVVGEVTCLLAPSEPVERYDYVRKLEDACGQAVRKAAWLAAHLGEVAKRGGPGDRELRVVTLVVVNQSNGVEWSYDGCVVIDTRFLELFLGAGSFRKAAVVFSEEGREPVMFTHELYASVAGIPGMSPFRDAVAWDETVLPLCAGRDLRLDHPSMDVDTYVAGMPNLADLAADAQFPGGRRYVASRSDGRTACSTGRPGPGVFGASRPSGRSRGAGTAT